MTKRIKSKINYRKIYEQHHGSIPIDENGRSYDIHHIDGNHTNNNISNLKAVTIQEHYNIHYEQGDYGACLAISKRSRIPVEEFSELARSAAIKRVKDGTHHFLGSSNPVHEKVANGTHNFLGPESNRRRIENGTHNFLGPESNRKRIKNGTHNFLGPNTNIKRVKNKTHNFLKENGGSNIARKIANERLEHGTHHFLGPSNPVFKQLENGTHPFKGGEVASRVALTQLAEGRHHSQQEYTCPHCGKVGKSVSMFRHHFDKCKKKK